MYPQFFTRVVKKNIYVAGLNWLNNKKTGPLYVYCLGCDWMTVNVSNCDWFMLAVDQMSVEAVTSVIVALVGLKLQDLLDVLSVRYIALVVCLGLLYLQTGGVRIRLDFTLFKLHASYNISKL